MDPKIIGLIAAGVGILIPLLAQESLKEIIKKTFSDVSPKTMRAILLICIVAAGGLLYVGGFTIAEVVQTEEPEPEPVVVQSAKTKEEVIVDAVIEGIERTQEFVENKREKDSTFRANREKFWVYKIGINIDDESDAWDAALKVNSLGDISIFKEGRKNYFIICDPAWEKTMLDDSLSRFQDKLDSIGLSYRIEIVDLMDKCSKKETITQTSAIEKKKEEITFPCLTCDK